MKEHTPPPQSHFIWQPILLAAVTGYLVAEIYFLTLMVNTFDSATRASDYATLEVAGRLISGAGIGLSALIGLSLNRRLNESTAIKRISLKLIIFILCTALGYIAVKSLYQVMENNASKSIVHCSVLGNAAIRVFDRGLLPGFEFEAEMQLKSGPISKSLSQRQLIRLYLPLRVCIDDNYRRELQRNEEVRMELTSMVMETGLPKKIASPAIDIYVGFRAQITRFTNELAGLTAPGLDPEQRFLVRAEAIVRLTGYLQSQSRYTSNDVQHIVSIYVCALDTAFTRGPALELEERFMLSVTDCLYDRVRSRFQTIPGVLNAVDIHQLEEAIATDWARQFILSPHRIPDKALTLMRHSFALVFLPIYAVLISTFVVFICLASYVRTRFLIRACKSQQRVNPVVNAMLSPLVVVPAIWTLLFVWVPEPKVEKDLFPGHVQSAWVRAVKVTLRPLFYYYDSSFKVLSNLNLPVTLISPNAMKQQITSRTNEQITRFSELQGFYIGEICFGVCQRVVLDLHPQSEVYGYLRYEPSLCETRLIFDVENQGEFRYFEVSKHKNDCRREAIWLVTASEDGYLNTEIHFGDERASVALRNLKI